MIPGAARGQSDRQAAPAKVMILGTFHFDNPGQDAFNVKVPDVLTPQKQAEIQAVADSLSRYRPTKIAIEAEPEYAATFDSLYRAYRAGSHKLTHNERQQLGFRLAARFNLPKLYPVDFKYPFPGQKVLDFAQKHDTAFVHYFRQWGQRHTRRQGQMLHDSTIARTLRYENSPEALKSQREMYARAAAVGNDSVHVGADLVAKWHRRNIRIFANISHITEPGDRVLVIIGGGHAPLLRYFVQSSKTMRLVSPLDFL